MSHFINYVKDRIERNKNFLGCITGSTGSGKTYSALRLAQELDSNFTIDRVAFSALEFMQILNGGELEAGSVIVFDEAGVGLSAQEWQSIQNKLVNYVLQTFRHRNYIVIFTTPHFGFVAAQSRKLFHCLMETKGIDKHRNRCKVRPLFLQTNQRKGDVYYKYLRVVQGGKSIPLKQLLVPLPSKELRVAYEKKKDDYTAKLNARILAELEEKTSGKKKRLTERQKEVIDLLNQDYTVEQVSGHLEINPRAVYDHMAAIEKKGYEIKRIKDGLEVKRYEVLEI